MVAKENDIRIPGFSPLFNSEKISKFLSEYPGPWVVKPRTDAGALGIRKIHNADDYWKWNDEHIENRHNYLIEQFKPGDVYHVDSLFEDYKSLFTRSSRYLQPPFEVAHGGGIFRSQTLAVSHTESKELKQFNDKLLKAFGLNFGASHSEFIKCHEDGQFYFLETSARVGGAHVADMVHAASGINLWAEWAKLEFSKLSGSKYKLPSQEKSNAGIIVTLSRYQKTDYSVFDEPSIWWTLKKDHHVGMILKDDSPEVVKSKLDVLTDRIYKDFHGTVPLRE